MTSLDTPDLPTTEAGRAAILDMENDLEPSDAIAYWTTTIVDIERQAVANHDAALRVAVKGLATYQRPDFGGTTIRVVDRAAVLALLSEGTPEPGWTYSLTASGPNGELFLVTDATGHNIGYATKIGGPLAAALREQPEKETP